LTFAQFYAIFSNRYKQTRKYIMEENMARIQSWEVSDAFWERVELLIPPNERDPNKMYKRKAGGGRKPIPPRKIFEAILYVLRTGCQWKALPKERFGSPSAIHTHFMRWMRVGFFVALWRVGLAEYDEMEGIAWSWQSIDAALVKAPLALQAVGRNPTDRGKKRKQTPLINGRPWCPAVNRRYRSQQA
jgi:transposase